MRTLIFTLGTLVFILMVQFQAIAFPLKDSVLVLDALNETTLPRHFRTTSVPLPPHSMISSEGLASLHLAGSAQFSELQFQKILQHVPRKKLVVIDLREETHGFLNAHAISWYGVRNAANMGKNPHAIKVHEKKQMKVLCQTKSVTVYKILSKEDDGRIGKVEPFIVSIDNAFSEEKFMKRQGIPYYRLYVTDHHAPRYQAVDHFISKANQLNDRWIYFHCRAGSGRSTTFMVMLDMLRNAKKVRFNDILARQALIGGKDLRKLPASSSYKYPLAIERLRFLKDFYFYCRQNNDDFKTSWSEWAKRA